MRDDYKIFISYRRADKSQAANIISGLVTLYGDRAIFFDETSIRAGTDFRESIEKAIARCKVGLVIIGKNWEGAEPSGRRIDDESDFVRMEVQLLLRRRIPVIPLLVGGRKELPENLPVGIEDLAFRQSLTLNFSMFGGNVITARDLAYHIDDAL